MFRNLNALRILPLFAAISLAHASGCTADNVGSDEHFETWDDANRPETFGVRSMKISELQHEDALKGYLEAEPWADTYWPLNKKGMSQRWNGGSNFENFDEQMEDAKTALGAEPAEGASAWAATFKLSPAEKYDILMRDDAFTMTKEGWDVYNQYEDYEFNWSWMGHCHGWAPAAYLETAPAASVIADIDGQKVMFTEGDIRGLMTKAYSENRMSQPTPFLGSRCNERTIVKDELGRIVDGTMYDIAPAEATGEGGAGGEAPVDEEAKPKADTETASTIYIKRNFWSRYHLLTFTTSPDSDEEKVLQATANAESPKSSFVVNVYASVRDYQLQQVESTQIFLYNKACRDTNAGAFHLVLAQYLGDMNETKKSFVMDVTREDQVWNQPVYGYESTIKSVENVEDIEDPLKDFRAEGTAQIAQVETVVHYALEKGPFVDYDESNNAKITSKTYKYSLELDAEGFVIGGEWDVSSNSWGSSPAPDFLWAPQGTLTDSNEVSYTMIKKLHDCSMNAEAAQEVTTPSGSTILAVECTL